MTVQTPWSNRQVGIVVFISTLFLFAPVVAFMFLQDPVVHDREPRDNVKDMIRALNVESPTVVDLKSDVIYLAGTQVTDNELKRLSELPRIRFLSLNSTGIGDKGLENLKSLTDLEELQLNGTKVTNDGLRHLTGLKKLRLLTLNDTKITDAAVDHLASMTNLRKLCLFHVKFSEDGFEKLAKALPTCEILQDNPVGHPKTPHKFLTHGYPDEALAMMKANPKWINHRDKESKTPLILAAAYRHAEVVKWLLEHGANVNHFNKFSGTVLHECDDPEIVALILKYKPNLNIRSSRGMPLQYAAERFSRPVFPDEGPKWRRIVDAYLAAGAEYDVLTAIRLDDLDQVRKILRDSPELADDFQDHSLLRPAASLGRFEICRYLIKQHDVDVDDVDRGYVPIIVEAVAYPQVVQLLIDHGAEFDSRITERLEFRISPPRLIEGDATLLHYAARAGVPETVKLLIDLGIDIFAVASSETETTEGITALEVAAHYGKDSNCTAILNHANFDRGKQQMRQRILGNCLCFAVVPAMFSDSYERRPLVELLLKKGADPNASYREITAVQYAMGATGGYYNDETKQNLRDIVSLLTQHGALATLPNSQTVKSE